MTKTQKYNNVQHMYNLYMLGKTEFNIFDEIPYKLFDFDNKTKNIVEVMPQFVEEEIERFEKIEKENGEMFYLIVSKILKLTQNTDGLKIALYNTTLNCIIYKDGNEIHYTIRNTDYTIKTGTFKMDNKEWYYGLLGKIFNMALDIDYIMYTNYTEPEED